MLAPENYSTIRSYAQSYKDVLKTELGRGVVSANPDNDVFAVLMEKQRIIDLANKAGCEYLAAIIGVQLTGGVPTNLTISILCADSNGEILDAHKTGGLQGEEVWPNKKI